MPRIRSVHPGLFTDEAFLDASPLARLFLIGLACEAYDDGVFEWKPRQLKVRLLPVDKADADALLDELQNLGFLHRYRFKGRDLGALRNFQKWQSPQKPKSSNLLPPELIPYVSVGSPFPVRIRDDYDTDTVTISSGEEGRGEERKGEEKRLAPLRARGAGTREAPAENPEDSDATGLPSGHDLPQDRATTSGVAVPPRPSGPVAVPTPSRPPRVVDPREARWRGLVGDLPVLIDPDLSPLRALLDEPMIIEADVDAGIAAYVAKARRKPRCWAEFENWIRGAAKDRLAAAKPYPGQSADPAPPTPEQDRRGRLAKAIAHFRGEWRQGWPEEMRPGHASCTTAADIVEEAQRAVAIERGEMEAA